MRHSNRVALSCDRAGCLVEVLRDDIGVFTEPCIGRPLAQYVTPASMNKFFEMLVELQRESVVFGWDLHLQAGAREILLNVAGAQRGDSILFIASDDNQDVDLFNDELVRINNEQVNQLRAMIKGHDRKRPDSDPNLLERLSAVGNELATSQRRLAKQEQELEHLAEARNQLVGMIAHDLRSPLMAIQGFTELLFNDADLTSDQASLAGRVQQSCEYMTRLVYDTLDWTQLEAAKVTLHPEPTDMNALVEHVLQAQRIVADSRSTRIQFTAGDDLPLVTVDSVRMEQVLDNLVSNAIKHAPLGSEVRMSLDLSAHGTGDTLCLTVSNPGPGILEEELETVFSPFSRASTKDPSSFGLGLAIVKHLVELHGGKVGIDSDPESGTRVEVTLPLR